VFDFEERMRMVIVDFAVFTDVEIRANHAFESCSLNILFLTNITDNVAMYNFRLGLPFAASSR
jgi:hypothetical protein